MKLNPKRIAYHAIVFFPFILILPFACVGWVFKWIIERYLDFAWWLQSKLLNDR